MQIVVGPRAEMPPHVARAEKATETRKTPPVGARELHPASTPLQNQPGLLARLREFVKSIIGAWL
jgi:hypothetical protein